jgi:Fic/DOC family
MNIYERVAENNRIEGIDRAPTDEEIREHERFVRLEKVSISELEQFVRIYQPGNSRLRSIPGLNVQVGCHVPPRGGEHILAQLQALVMDINACKVSAWDAHVQYATLHPFTDGNGRSSRVLWYWMMRNTSRVTLGFLHAFYYQTLNKCASREVI